MFVIPQQLDKTKDLSELKDRLNSIEDPDDRLTAIREFVKEKKIVYKEASSAVHHESLPRYILDITPHSAVLVASADKIPMGATIRIVYGVMPGGPYSFLGGQVASNGTLGQPVVARVEGLLPTTQYFFRLQVVHDGEITYQSEEFSFTTGSYKLQVLPSSDLRPFSARVSGQAHLVPRNRRVLLGFREEGEEDYHIVQDEPGSAAIDQHISATLTRLSPGKKYYYSLCVLDERGMTIEDSRERGFTAPSPRAVADTEIRDLLATSVTLLGFADFVTESQSLQIKVKSVSEPFAVSKGLDQAGQTIVTQVRDLQPNKSYEFQVQVVGNDKVLYESDKITFKTKEFNLKASVGNVKTSSVLLRGFAENVSPHEVIALKLNGEAVFSGVGKNELVFTVQDLLPNTEYQAMVVVGSHESEPVVFKTETFSPQTLGAVSVTDRTATIMAVADFVPPQSNARFAWGTEPGKMTSFSPLLFGDNIESQTFAFLAYGLSPRTQYHFRLEIMSSDGTTVLAHSEEDTFETGEPQRMRKA